MAHSVRTTSDLIAAGLASPTDEPALAQVVTRYAMAITPAMTALIDPNDPGDPIGRQFIPDPVELTLTPGEHPDPIGDQRYTPVPGLVHRYPDRVLLTPIFACAVYCRFCFRRERVGPGHGTMGLSPHDLACALDYIRTKPAIWEVILTGGDPLMLAARQLDELLVALDAIPHVGVVRLHSRVPMVAPERIDSAVLAALRRSSKAVYVAVHANHPREFTQAARAALGRLIEARVALISQSVLLAGINDDAATLEMLMRRFVENRVKPYYLHHLDAAPGTARFQVSLEQGQALMNSLRGKVSGLCQPHYMLDIPGGHGKSPIGPAWLASDGHKVRDWRGNRHPLPKTHTPSRTKA